MTVTFELQSTPGKLMSKELLVMETASLPKVHVADNELTVVGVKTFFGTKIFHYCVCSYI